MHLRRLHHLPLPPRPLQRNHQRPKCCPHRRHRRRNHHWPLQRLHHSPRPPTLKPTLPRQHLQTKILWPHPNPPPTELSQACHDRNIKLVLQSTELLGCSVGCDDDATRLHAINKVNNIPFHTLTHPLLPKQMATHLLRSCPSGSMNYLARTHATPHPRSHRPLRLHTPQPLRPTQPTPPTTICPSSRRSTPRPRPPPEQLPRPHTPSIQHLTHSHNTLRLQHVHP